MLLSREELEKNEASILAPYAVKSRDTVGRKFPEMPDPYRLCFQKDKERVIHSKAFRRLDEKTQVFMAGSGDHYRTRLTHSLEVAQVARGIARRLGLNEDLAEVIALAHDLGHPPYGHGGEEALNDMMERYGAHFEHNEQSRRVVEKLENPYPGFLGLNLSIEVIDGLIKHQTAFDQAGKKFELTAHLEAQVVNLADEIAYLNHDTDDALRSGLIKLKDLDSFKLWNMAALKVKEKYGEISSTDVLISRTVSSMISIMIDDLCKETYMRIESGLDIYAGPVVCFSSEMWEMLKVLRNFLFENFYMNDEIVKFVDIGKKMIKELFEFYMENPEKLPEKYASRNDEELFVVVKDYIAGMTDSYLLKEYDIVIS